MKRNPAKLPFKAEIMLPIYCARIQLIVSDDITAERKAQEHLFGPLYGTCYTALCSWSQGHNFALFFEPEGLTHRVIAHEVFHLTHRILEWSGTRFSETNHEPFACLIGELHEWVFRLIGGRVQPDSFYLGKVAP